MFLWGVALNYVSLSEAFGNGPPYYGRTEHMDKWSNPVPILAVIDAVILIVVVGITLLVVRLVNPSRFGQRAGQESGESP